jgi:hypothetical protein
VDRAGVETARDFLEQLHSLRVDIMVVGVMGQVAGEQYEIRPLRRFVE